MAKRTRRALSEKEVLELIRKEKKTNYGEAGAPPVSNTRNYKTRQIHYGENKFDSLLKSFGFNYGDSDAEMRRLSIETEPLRNCIELRKSQFNLLTPSITTKSNNKVNRVSKELMNFLMYPDGINPFSVWIGMLIEEFYTIDAIAISPERNGKGEITELLILDGADIYPLTDFRGVLPKEGTAYQQRIDNKVYDFTREQLAYFNKNKRVHTKERLSTVAMCKKLAILFNASTKDMLSYHIDGNVPYTIATIKNLAAKDAFSSTPLAPEMTADGIVDGSGINFLDMIRAIWEDQNNGANKNLLKFLPDVEFHKLKDVDLKTELQDWIIRMICATFRIPYDAYVSNVNRATAETSKQMNDQDGLGDLKNYIESIINFIIHNHFNQKDVVFKLIADKEIDPKQQVERLTALVNNNIITVNEAREELGYESLDKKETPDDIDDENADNDDNDDVEVSDFKKIKKAKKNDAIEKSLNETEEKLNALFFELLTSQKESILKAIRSGETITEELLKSLNISEKTSKELIENFLLIVRGFSVTHLDEIFTENEISNALALAKTIDAVPEIAETRVKNLLGIIQSNPEKSFDINQTTRTLIKSKIDEAMSGGWSNEKLAKELEENFAFSKDRSESIARTETANAASETSELGYINAGIKEQSWSTAYDNKACDECLANEQQGPIFIGTAFSSGAFRPPSHPKCRCVLMPVFRNYKDKS